MPELLQKPVHAFTPRPKPMRPVLWLALGGAASVAITIAIGRAAGATTWATWLILMCTYYAVRDPDTALAVFAFGAPYELVFFGWGAGRYNMFGYIALGFLAFWMFTGGRVARRIALPEGAYALLIVWMALSIIWSDDRDMAAAMVFTHAGLLATMMLFARATTGPQSAMRILRYLIGGTLTLAVVLAFYYQRTAYIEQYGRQYVSTFGSADEVSASEFGNICLTAFLGCLVLVEFEKSTRRRLVSLALAGVLATLVILTVGRSLALGLVITSLIWALVRGVRLSRAAKLAGVFTLASVALIGALFVNRDALELRWSLTADYIEEGNVVALTTGRSVIWQAGVDMFVQNPVTGVGVGQFADHYMAITQGYRRGPHSAFIAMFAETGAVGGVLFLMLLAGLAVLAVRCWVWRGAAIAWWMYFVVECFGHLYGRAKAFWIVAGLTIALVRWSQERDRATPAAIVRRPAA